MAKETSIFENSVAVIIGPSAELGVIGSSKLTRNRLKSVSIWERFHPKLSEEVTARLSICVLSALPPIKSVKNATTKRDDNAIADQLRILDRFFIGVVLI